MTPPRVHMKHRVFDFFCSNSDSEARINQAKLQDLVEQVLAENVQLRQKLQMSQDSFDARNIATRHPGCDGTTARFGDDVSTLRSLQGIRRSETMRSTMTGVRNSMIRFAFENILEGSRVYKRTAHFHECDQSFASSAIRSIFTGYSLADISILSVIAMPFCAEEISNACHYIIQEENREPQSPDALWSQNRQPRSVNPALRNTVAGTPDLRVGDTSQSWAGDLHPEILDAFDALQVLEECTEPEPSTQRVITSSHISTEQSDRDSSSAEYRPSEATAPPQDTPDTSITNGSIEPAPGRLHSHSASLAALEGSPTRRDSDSMSAYAASVLGSLDESEEAYPCQGCGKV